MTPAPQSVVDAATRREQLVLLCALDRARLRLITRPEPAAAPGSTDWIKKGREVLAILLPAMPMILGRWTRYAALGAGLFRATR